MNCGHFDLTDTGAHALGTGSYPHLHIIFPAGVSGFYGSSSDTDAEVIGRVVDLNAADEGSAFDLSSDVFVKSPDASSGSPVRVVWVGW